jgi:ferredoxin
MNYIEFDRGRCEGHGTCEQIAPSIYRLDDEGELDILVNPPLPDDLVQLAKAGARVCPVAALRVVSNP